MGLAYISRGIADHGRVCDFGAERHGERSRGEPSAGGLEEHLERMCVGWDM